MVCIPNEPIEIQWLLVAFFVAVQVQTVHCNSVLGALKRAGHWQHALWMFHHLSPGDTGGVRSLCFPESGQSKIRTKICGSLDHDLGCYKKCSEVFGSIGKKYSEHMFRVVFTGHRWHRVLTTILWN